ncbi:hypothetical protein WA026_007325 [Henosepilachna vigintioctopunctata]|uniref:Uncharacterized protein n=1 Tax=Henosepilachna vigintioctopunctata TaxID=420089 RepID=A0AAW1UNV5_9CUCU
MSFIIHFGRLHTDEGNVQTVEMNNGMRDNAINAPAMRCLQWEMRIGVPLEAKVGSKNAEMVQISPRYYNRTVRHLNLGQILSLEFDSFVT